MRELRIFDAEAEAAFSAFLPREPSPEDRRELSPDGSTRYSPI